MADARTRPRALVERGRNTCRAARPRTTALFGIPLAEVAYSDVIGLVNQTLGRPQSEVLAIDAINTMGISESCLNPLMREALRCYDVIVPDGMPLVWCMNTKGTVMRDRVYGPYLVDRLLASLESRTRVAVIGGFEDVHDWLRKTGPSRYPNADFTLLYNAPPTSIDDEYVLDCVTRIEASGARLVFVCLGVPRQYYWTALARNHLDGRVVLSVGGAFDLVSGRNAYAPAWLQRAGLTWLHRLSQEPRRLAPRYLKYNSAFLWLLLRREFFPQLVQRRATGT